MLGATGLVGSFLLPLLTRAGWRVEAFSRRETAAAEVQLQWRTLASASLADPGGKIESWICVGPISILPDYFGLMERCGARRIVALSSTSLLTKGSSSDSGERKIVESLATGESRLRDWSDAEGTEWVILRPTLIYGRGRDANIAEMARFIRRFGFFPLLGRAGGLRQPVHAEDVALACVAAISVTASKNRAYNLGGGETLTYRDMADRVFSALGLRPRYLAVPLWIFSAGLTLLRRLPRYRGWTAAMAERMNRDLVFDDADAKRDLGYAPRPFRPGADELPV